MIKYQPIDLHKKKSDILVIHCSDPRFQDAYHHEIGRINSYHDLLVVPGASKAIVDNLSILDYAKLLQTLHHFTEIHILDHIDCGAFGPVKDEIAAHSASLKAAQDKLVAAMPDIVVKTYLLGEHDKLLASG
jgi:carbonic anhydrase